MDLVIVNNGIPSTTSLAIADGTGVEHASVILMVRKYADDLNEFGLVDFKSESSAGRPVEYAVLNEQQTTLLMTYMRNSDVVRNFKKALVKAFYELAQQSALAKFNLPTDYPGAMRLAADLSEQKAAVEAQLAIAAPKVEAFERIAGADGSLCLTDAAKELQLRPKDLNAWMQANQWIYKRAGGASWVGYQNHIQCGNLIHRSRVVPDANGDDHIRDQVRVTGKGLARLATLFQKVAA